MIITKEEMQRRLQSSKNLSNLTKPAKDLLEGFEGEGGVTVDPLPKRDYTHKNPIPIRAIAGILSKSGERSKNLESAFNLTPSQVQCARRVPDAVKGMERIHE